MGLFAPIIELTHTITFQPLFYHEQVLVFGAKEIVCHQIDDRYHSRHMICIHNLGHMNQNIHPVGLVVPTPIWNRIDLMDDSIKTIWYSASFAWRQMIPCGVCGTKRCPNETNPLRLQAVNRVNGLVQDCNISIALAMEILQSCTKLSMWWVQNK